MAGSFAGDREAVKLARQTDREIADVDHLLHFAEPFLQDLSVLDGDEAPERLLVGAQLLAEQAHQFAAPGRRHVAPLAERFDAGFDLRRDGCSVVESYSADLGSVDRRMHDLRAARRDAEFGEKMVVHGFIPVSAAYA